MKKENGESKNIFMDSWGAIKKKLPMLLLISVTAAVLALVIAKQVAPSYEVHFSYVVSLAQREAAPEYRFDGYYALQATDLFSATLAEWLTAPETVVAAYQAAGLALPSEDPRQVTRALRAEKAAAQLVTVTVRSAQREEAEKLADGLRQVMAKNIQAYHDQGAPAAQFRAVATTPWTGVIWLSIPIVVLATFVFTFFIALNVILLNESRR